MEKIFYQEVDSERAWTELRPNEIKGWKSASGWLEKSG